MNFEKNILILVILRKGKLHHELGKKEKKEK